MKVTQAAAVNVLDVYWDTAASVYLLLYNSALASSPPTEAEIFAAEVAEENGYARNSIPPTTPAAWVAANNAAERVMANSTVTAAGGTIAYDSFAVVRDGAASANKIVTANNANNSFSCIGHGLTTGDRILITGDPTATLPAGINGLTFYYASVTDADNFTLLDSPGGAAIGFTSNGAGTLRLRYCAGSAGWPETLSSIRTIDPSGSPHPFTGITTYLEVE